MTKLSYMLLSFSVVYWQKRIPILLLLLDSVTLVLHGHLLTLRYPLMKSIYDQLLHLKTCKLFDHDIQECYSQYCYNFNRTKPGNSHPVSLTCVAKVFLSSLCYHCYAIMNLFIQCNFLQVSNMDFYLGDSIHLGFWLPLGWDVDWCFAAWTTCLYHVSWF